MVTTLQPTVGLLSTAHFLMLNSDAVGVKCLFGIFSLVLVLSPAFPPQIGPHLGSCNLLSSDTILSSWQSQLDLGFCENPNSNNCQQLLPLPRLPAEKFCTDLPDISWPHDGFFCQASFYLSQRHQCSPRTWGVDLPFNTVPRDALSNSSLLERSPHSCPWWDYHSSCLYVHILTPAGHLPTAARKCSRPNHVTQRLKTCCGYHLPLGSSLT